MLRKHARSPFLRLDVVSTEHQAQEVRGAREDEHLDEHGRQLFPFRSHLVRQPFKQSQSPDSPSTQPRRPARRSTPNSFFVMQEATKAERRAQDTEAPAADSLLVSTVNSLNQLQRTLRVKALGKPDESSRTTRQMLMMDQLVITPRTVVTTDYADLDYLHVDLRVGKQRDNAPEREPLNLDRRLGNIRARVCKQGKLLPYRPVVRSGPNMGECVGILPESEYAALAKSRTLNRRLAELAALHDYELRADSPYDSQRGTPSRTMRILEHVRRSMRSASTRSRPMHRSAARSTLFDESVNYYCDTQQSRTSVTARSSEGEVGQQSEASDFAHPSGPRASRLRSAGSVSSSSVAAFTLHADVANTNGMLVRPSSHRASVPSTPCSLSFRAPLANSSDLPSDSHRSVLSNSVASRVNSADLRKRVSSAGSAASRNDTGDYRRRLGSASSGKRSAALPMPSQSDEAEVEVEAEAEAERGDTRASQKSAESEAPSEPTEKTDKNADSQPDSDAVELHRTFVRFAEP